jgi:hypothetical protein
MIVVGGIFFGWFYALGTRLQEKLPIGVDMNIRRFKISLLIPVLYIFTLSVFMYSRLSYGTAFDQPRPGIIALIVPFHLIAMFCIFYCLYFNAKALKTVEWQRQVSFSDFAGEFFLIWFFPFGIWIIQPRINKLFADSTEEFNGQSGIR